MATKKTPTKSSSNSLQSIDHAGGEGEKDPGSPGSPATLKNMTMLPPDSIRWMNRRRPLSQTISKPSHIPPHQASQLREMFDGLDFDGGGEIDLKEFKDAIAYVSEHSTVGTNAILGDPKNVTAIFRAMDADGSGTVDFDEFVLAMTADNNSNSSSGGPTDLSKLRSTFYDFANVHRRQNMLEVIKDKTSSDRVKFQEFERLFEVQYFSAEEINLSVEEQVAKTTKEVMKEKKKLGKLYKESRHKEIVRSRAADCITKSEKQRMARYHKPGTKFEIPDINKSSQQYQKRKQFSEKMEDFSIAKRTYLPSVSDKTQIRRHQANTLNTLRTSRSVDKQLLIPPAVSVRKEWDLKALTYEKTGEF
jgi:Ca2+-binding EF-hand superfamily protein